MPLVDSTDLTGTSGYSEPLERNGSEPKLAWPLPKGTAKWIRDTLPFSRKHSREKELRGGN
jgi:hypothetical protein